MTQYMVLDSRKKLAPSRLPRNISSPSVDKIQCPLWKNFDQWLKNGSGWILDRVEDIQLKTARYEPMSGSSYIPTPESIKQ